MYIILQMAYLLATAQAPMSSFFAGPDVGEISKSKMSMGKPLQERWILIKASDIDHREIKG